MAPKKKAAERQFKPDTSTNARGETTVFNQENVDRRTASEQSRQQPQQKTPFVDSVAEVERIANEKNKAAGFPEQQPRQGLNIQPVEEKERFLGLPVNPQDRSILGGLIGLGPKEDPLNMTKPVTGRDLAVGVGGGVTVGAGAIAAASLLAGLTSAGTAAATSEGLSSAEVAKAATGKIVSRFGTAAETALAKQTNTVLAKKSVSYLSKLASAAKNPVAVLGAISAAIGTYPWASWAKKETIDSLVFARKDAVKSGDTALVQEIDALLDDILDTDFWNVLPVANVISRDMESLKANLLAMRANEAANARRLNEEDLRNEEENKKNEKFNANSAAADKRNADANKRNADANARQKAFEKRQEEAKQKGEPFDPEKFKKSQLTFGLLK